MGTQKRFAGADRLNRNSKDSGRGWLGIVVHWIRSLVHFCYILASVDVLGVCAVAWWAEANKHSRQCRSCVAKAVAWQASLGEWPALCTVAWQNQWRRDSPGMHCRSTAATKLDSSLDCDRPQLGHSARDALRQFDQHWLIQLMRPNFPLLLDAFCGQLDHYIFICYFTTNKLLVTIRHAINFWHFVTHNSGLINHSEWMNEWL